jgi:hypothetical protein
MLLNENSSTSCGMCLLCLWCCYMRMCIKQNHSADTLLLCALQFSSLQLTWHL